MTQVKPKYQVIENIQGIIVGVRQVQNRGRIQIPKKVRDNLGLKDGDSVYWIEDKGRFYIAKAVEIR